jgi:probable HAF family extracellular repeat protein
MKTILTSIAAGSLLAAFAMAQQQPSYRVIDLGTLGGTYSVGFGINNNGDVAGQAATPAQTNGFDATAVVWRRHNGITNLGVFGPPLFPFCPTCSSDAAAVGASGEVAMGSEIATLDPNGEDFGQFNPPNPTHRVMRGSIWRNGVMTVLPNLPGGNNANVFWINNLGQISGVAENGTFDSSCSMVTPFQVYRFQPVIWGPNGEIQRVLSPLVTKDVTDTVAVAFTINDHGQTVGNSGLCSTAGLPPAAINNTTAAHAVLWESDGSVHDLGSLGGALNGASSINNRGEVVGVAQSPQDGTVHAFLWTRHTGMLDYGAFPGAVATIVGCCHTNNDRGEIVGFSIEPSNPYFGRALIWQASSRRTSTISSATPDRLCKLPALSRSTIPERSSARASRTPESCTPAWLCRITVQGSTRAFRPPHGNWAAQCLSPITPASCFDADSGCAGGRGEK